MNTIQLNAAPQAQTLAPEVLDQENLKKFQHELQLMTHALEQKLPGLSQQLQKMNDLLRQYPETVALLTPEEIGGMMKGVIQESKVQFALGSTGATRGAAKSDIFKKINSASFDPSQIKF